MASDADKFSTSKMFNLRLKTFWLSCAPCPPCDLYTHSPSLLSIMSAHFVFHAALSLFSAPPQGIQPPISSLRRTRQHVLDLLALPAIELAPAPAPNPNPTPTRWPRRRRLRPATLIGFESERTLMEAQTGRR